MINTRHAAANRDDRHCPDPDRLDLTRRNGAGACGSGVHHCLGAPPARRELCWGFRAFIDRVEDFELTPDRNTPRHAPNLAPQALHMAFRKTVPEAEATA